MRRRWIRRLLLSFTAAAVPYAVLLARPQIVFAYEVRAENVVLHARSPLPGRAAEIAAAALLDHKGMTVEALLSHPIDAAPIEKELAGR